MDEHHRLAAVFVRRVVLLVAVAVVGAAVAVAVLGIAPAVALTAFVVGAAALTFNDRLL